MPYLIKMVNFKKVIKSYGQVIMYLGECKESGWRSFWREMSELVYFKKFSC
jgi:hypothetical protein